MAFLLIMLHPPKFDRRLLIILSLIASLIMLGLPRCARRVFGSLWNETDINATDKDRRTALDYMTKEGKFDALLWKGGDVKAIDKDGETTLHGAAKEAKTRILNVVTAGRQGDLKR
jgi:hypothetical protein